MEFILFFPKPTRWELNLEIRVCAWVSRGEFASKREPGVTDGPGAARVGNSGPASGETHHLAGSPRSSLTPQAVAVVIGDTRWKSRWPQSQPVWIGFRAQSLFYSPNPVPLSDKSRLKRRLITVLRVVRQTMIGRSAQGFGP